MSSNSGPKRGSSPAAEHTENFAAKRQRLAKPFQDIPDAIDLTGDGPDSPGPVSVRGPSGGQHALHPAREEAAARRPGRLRPVRPGPASPEVEVLDLLSPPAGRYRRAGHPRAAAPTTAAARPAPSHPRSAAAAAAAAAAELRSAAAAAEVDPSEDADAALARRLQEEEDRKLVEAEARLQERLQELEAAEAAEVAEGEERPRRGLGFGWPFSRRHPPTTFSAGGGPPAQAAGTTGPRSRGRRSRWGGGPSFVDAMAGLLGTGGLGHRGGGAGYGGGGFGGHAPPHLPLALQQAMMGAQRGALPPQLLFSDRDFGEQDYEALLRLDEGLENRRGASKQVIDSLETVRLPRAGRAAADGSGGGEPSSPEACAVCLEELRAGEVVRKLPCGHCYHKQCITRWLQQKAVCPVCQASIA